LEGIFVIGMRGHILGQEKPALAPSSPYAAASPYSAVFEQTDGSQHLTSCALDPLLQADCTNFQYTDREQAHCTNLWCGAKPTIFNLKST